jgi:hypothetical protein
LFLLPSWLNIGENYLNMGTLLALLIVILLGAVILVSMHRYESAHPPKPPAPLIEDVRDLLAAHGAGSFDRQFRVRTRRFVAGMGSVAPFFVIPFLTVLGLVLVFGLAQYLAQLFAAG